MAKKKPNSFGQAQELLGLRNRYRNLSLAAIALAVIIFIGYNVAVVSGILGESSSVVATLVYVVFLVFAAFVGTCTYKWTRYSRELKQFCQQRNINISEL